MSCITVFDMQNSKPAGQTNLSAYIDHCITHTDQN